MVRLISAVIAILLNTACGTTCPGGGSFQQAATCEDHWNCALGNYQVNCRSEDGGVGSDVLYDCECLVNSRVTKTFQSAGWCSADHFDRTPEINGRCGWSFTPLLGGRAWSFTLAASTVNIDPSNMISIAADRAARFVIIFFIMAFTLPDSEVVRYEEPCIPVLICINCGEEAKGNV